ncbi:MAG: TolC family protein [Planctomycetes bacterium]|nr:TolC family protein [Planctomycetota bacterium]
MSPALFPCARARRNVPALPLAAVLVLSACATAPEYRQEADADAYAILVRAHEEVTGEAKVERIGGAAGTLRETLKTQLAEGKAPVVRLDIPTALDVAAENSRDYLRQRESLYRTALSLTSARHDFELRWGGGAAADVSGVGTDTASLGLSDDLSASVRSTSGTRVVASFANNLFKSLLSGGAGWNESSILGLSLTQPLLRGAGESIVREPLTQAERDVVYAVRSFERFRATFAVNVVSEYFSLLAQLRNIDSQRRNLDGIRRAREQIQALYEAGRRPLGDLDRARQNELGAENALLNANNRLESALDSLKELLGLPMTAVIELDPAELERLAAMDVAPVGLDADTAVRLALQRRYDYRTARDRVEDSARQLVVAEDALGSTLDLSAAIQVPTEPGKAFVFDWSKVSWSAGFDLGLALDRLGERNAYRSAFISLDDRMRTRDELADQILQQVRAALRDIVTRVEDWKIQKNAVALAERRVDSTRELYLADRASALDLLDAEDDLLAARLGLTSATVDYSTSKLRLLRDLEGLEVEPRGLRFDPSLPLPTGPQDTRDAARALRP